VVSNTHNRPVSELAKSASRAAVDAAGNVVQTAVTAMLTVDLGPQLATAAGAMAGAVTKETPELLCLMLGDRFRRASTMVETATDLAGLTPEEFVARLARDELHRYLLYRAVQAAGTAIGDAKIRTLAAALVSGAIATDPAAVDEALVVINAVEQIESLHLRVLTRLMTAPADPAVDHYSNVRPWPWTQQQLYDADPGLGGAFGTVLAKLRSLGMVHDYPAGLIDYAEDRVQLTAFGEMCTTHLHQVGEDNRPVPKQSGH